MKKRIFKFFCVTIIIICLICGFVVINEMITENKNSMFKPLLDGNRYAYQVDKVYTDGENIVLKGWFIVLKSVQNAPQKIEDGKKIGVLLYDTNSQEITNTDSENSLQKGINLYVRKEDRKDVNDYFDCEFDYSSCGFVATIKKSSLDLTQKEYQVVFRIEGSEYGILSPYYIKNGVLSYIPSSEVMDLEVENTDIEKIVSEGNCIYSNPDKGVAIYQNAWKLYWILDKSKYKSEEHAIYLKLGMDTTQYNRLPETDISAGRYWCNQSDYADEYEITNKMNCGEYRVFTRDIPMDFSVYYIWNNINYKGEQIMDCYFRPVIFPSVNK